MHLLDQSKLIEDVLEEMDKWGGYEKWLHYFKLDGDRLGVALPEVDMYGERSRPARIDFALSLIGTTLGVLELVKRAVANGTGVAEGA
jgi:hypothetical protein